MKPPIDRKSSDICLAAGGGPFCGAGLCALRVVRIFVEACHVQPASQPGIWREPFEKHVLAKGDGAKVRYPNRKFHVCQGSRMSAIDEASGATLSASKRAKLAVGVSGFNMSSSQSADLLPGREPGFASYRQIGV